MDNKILIIEDNADIRESIAETLELHHYKVATASNGREGIARLSDVRPDLVLCDIMMPEADGYAVLEALHAMPDLKYVRFVFMTAKCSDSTGRVVSSTTADGLLPKPFDDVQLLQVVRRSLPLAV